MPGKKKSPLYNYKSPRDYKVFNMGNEASPPFKMSGMVFKGDQTPIKQLSSRAIDKEIKEIMEESIEIDVPENIEENTSGKVPLPKRSPAKQKGSPYKNKKNRVVTKINKDGSITKTDTKTGKSSTYRASKTETGKGKKYTNPQGRSFYTS